MERKKYYVNLGAQQITQTNFENTNVFTIYANADEVRLLRAKMDQMDRANIESFFRAHIPILAYHHDRPNDDYDEQMTEALQMIYELGDDQTKKHIKDIGVLEHRPL
ncbi:MAG TPA: hydrolase [Bacillota bacterium]